MSTKHEVAVELAGGKRLVFETGRIAKQASGSALVTTGETVVLATAVASPDPREGIDFFLCRRTHPRRVYQTRRPAQRERDSDCAAN
jgi:polyribonucleotide nucleotidyltransferase